MYSYFVDAETADVTINEESNDVQFNIIREQRQIVDHIHALMNEVNDIRTRRQIRRFTEHPYFIRNNLDTMSSNRIPNRRSVRFSANTHHLIDNVSFHNFLILFENNFTWYQFNLL